MRPPNEEKDGDFLQLGSWKWCGRYQMLGSLAEVRKEKNLSLCK